MICFIIWYLYTGLVISICYHLILKHEVEEVEENYPVIAVLLAKLIMLVSWPSIIYSLIKN